MSLPRTIRFTITRELAANALRSYQRKVAGTSEWIHSLLLWGMLTLPARWILSETLLMRSPRASQLLAASGISGLLVLILFLSRRRRRELMDVTEEEITFSFSEVGVEKRTGRSESAREWGAFSRFLELEEFFFLHESESVAEFFPKAAFTGPEELAEVRELLERSVPKTPVARKTRPVFYVLLVALIGFTLYSASQFRPPSGMEEVTLEEYLDLKEAGSLREVWISGDGELRADLISGSMLKGKSCSRIRSQLPRSSLGDPAAYERLVRGLPAEKVHDARRP